VGRVPHCPHVAQTGRNNGRRVRGGGVRGRMHKKKKKKGRKKKYGGGEKKAETRTSAVPHTERERERARFLRPATKDRIAGR